MNNTIQLLGVIHQNFAGQQCGAMSILCSAISGVMTL
jgi:hypothetical protein